MKRFNLLLVTKDAALRPAVLKVLSKVFKSNFVFELPSLEEAMHVLKKLHIDILMVDFDIVNADLVELNGCYPSMRIMGIASSPNQVKANIDMLRHRIFEKRDFALAFAAELKTQRKDFETPSATQGRRKGQEPAASTDFIDFHHLIQAN